MIKVNDCRRNGMCIQGGYIARLEGMPVCGMKSVCRRYMPRKKMGSACRGNERNIPPIGNAGGMYTAYGQCRRDGYRL